VPLTYTCTCILTTTKLDVTDHCWVSFLVNTMKMENISDFVSAKSIEITYSIMCTNVPNIMFIVRSSQNIAKNLYNLEFRIKKYEIPITGHNSFKDWRTSYAYLHIMAITFIVLSFIKISIEFRKSCKGKVFCIKNLKGQYSFKSRGDYFLCNKHI
jgi:hypothetical protein